MFFSVLFSVLAYIFGAVAYGGWFRILSIATPAAFILLAVARYAIAAPQSLIGSQERTMAYAFFMWVIALAVYLLALTGKGAVASGG